MISTKVASLRQKATSGCYVVRLPDGRGYSHGLDCTEEIRDSYVDMVEKAKEDLAVATERVYRTL